MNVSLTPELQKFIDEEVRAGRFSSTGEALEAGVARLMLDLDPFPINEATWEAIDEAEAAIDRGEGIPINEAFDRLRNTHAD